ncbi:MAG: Xaa-Pro aminopeptidase [Gammaproteobacteria bacterium]|nr:Xaa-Pro aminopeptidase [Gammaproteobacteria bacterium]
MNKKEFVKRRKQLMRSVGKEGIAILAASPVRQRNRDVEYPYRQESDFLYLSGFSEPEAVLVLIPKRPAGEFLLFCRESDPEQEIWHGRRAGLAGAVEEYGADDAFPISDMDEILPGLMEGRKRVFYTMGQDEGFDRRVVEWVNQLRAKVRSGLQAPSEFIDLDYHLHDLRLFKSRFEVATMREAARISMRAHKRAMQICRPGMMEYELEAEFLHEFRSAGAEPAYSSIVGGGENGCILHYTENNQKLNDGELVLIDAGAEHEGYASDVTRTFPVNGRFSPAQKEIYELVLASQEAAFLKCKPGNHWNDPHEAAVKVLTKGLVELGLLKGKPAALIKEAAYRQFYMHRTGHWLGMDVHDVGEYKVGDGWRLLEPGMAMTVEPGLYITPARGVAKRYHNIGVRIEDDIVITRDGYDLLSRGIPKTVAEIEAEMAK